MNATEKSLTETTMTPGTEVEFSVAGELIWAGRVIQDMGRMVEVRLYDGSIQEVDGEFLVVVNAGRCFKCGFKGPHSKAVCEM